MVFSKELSFGTDKIRKRTFTIMKEERKKRNTISTMNDKRPQLNFSDRKEMRRMQIFKDVLKNLS